MQALVALNQSHQWCCAGGRRGNHVDQCSTAGAWMRLLFSKYWAVFSDPEAKRRCFSMAICNISKRQCLAAQMQ